MVSGWVLYTIVKCVGQRQDTTSLACHSVEGILFVYRLLVCVNTLSLYTRANSHVSVSSCLCRWLWTSHLSRPAVIIVILLYVSRVLNGSFVCLSSLCLWLPFKECIVLSDTSSLISLLSSSISVEWIERFCWHFSRKSSNVMYFFWNKVGTLLENNLDREWKERCFSVW